MTTPKNVSRLLFIPLLSLMICCCTNREKREEKAASNPENQPMDTVVKSKEIHLMVSGLAGKIHVNDGGSGGIPVVFVHSFLGDTYQWSEQVDHLRAYRRAVAMDLRGHGKSDPPANNDYSIEALVKDIATVVDNLKLDTFVLVGHSMGGSAAIAYAGKNPERVAGLLLVGTPGKTPPETSKPIIASLKSDKYDTVMNDYMRKLTQDAKPTTYDQVMSKTEALSKDASVAMIEAIFKYDPLPDLRRYPGPKMIVSSIREEQQPNTLSKSFPAIPHKIIDGTSHWIQLDKPTDFNGVLDEFLKMVDQTR
jgi:pimeloyl-ACP methyl ester carboxylesterase